MDRWQSFGSNLLSLLIAVARFFFLVISLIPAGLQIILFSKTEICNVEMQGLPWRCDRDKMNEQISFVDKLYRDNPDLIELDPEGLDDLSSEDEDNDNGKK